MKTAIIIPAYNEAGTIGEVVRGVAEYGLPIVVDDNSADDTADIAEASGAEVVRRTDNGGYDAAIQSGFERADALHVEVSATFDADGQHVPEVLGGLFAPILEGRVRLVVGARPSTARLAESVFGVYTNLRYRLPDPLCGMKAYSMSLYREHGCFDSTRSIGTELTLYALRSKEPFEVLPVPVRERIGRSRFGASIRGEMKILWAFWLAVKGASAHGCGS